MGEIFIDWSVFLISSYPWTTQFSIHRDNFSKDSNILIKYRDKKSCNLNPNILDVYTECKMHLFQLNIKSNETFLTAKEQFNKGLSGCSFCLSVTKVEILLLNVYAPSKHPPSTSQAPPKHAPSTLQAPSSTLQAPSSTLLSQLPRTYFAVLVNYSLTLCYWDKSGSKSATVGRAWLWGI